MAWKIGKGYPRLAGPAAQEGRVIGGRREGLSEFRYEPESETSGMTRVTPPEPSGSHSRSAPTAEMSSRRRCSVDAMVASRPGSASAPPRILRPSTPPEQSPDTGSTPERRPALELKQSPESHGARRSLAAPRPGATGDAEVPTTGLREAHH